MLYTLTNGAYSHSTLQRQQSMTLPTRALVVQPREQVGVVWGKREGCYRKGCFRGVVR